jgi:hypothetical protein
MKMNICQNLGEAAKTVLRGKCIALTAYIKEAKSNINSLLFHLGYLEQEQKTNTKIHSEGPHNDGFGQCWIT